MEENNYQIKVVSKLTGVSDHIIRKWEQRYNAVTPQRTDSNRRLYSWSDIERLRLLKAATELGHNIGNAAAWNNDVLKKLTLPHDISEKISSTSKNGTSLLNDSQYHYSKCEEAVKKFDPQSLRSSLYSAEHQLSKRILLEQVVIPLLQTIGTLWENELISAAHEHTASAVIRTYVGNQLSSFDILENAPVIILASPAGQRHEIGALIAAIIAMSEGWNAIYLGADLPANEIITAARSQNAQIIAVSIVYPENSQDTRDELAELKKEIGDEIYFIAGGRASLSYKDLFNDSNSRIFQDFNRFSIFLREKKATTQ
ncbi:MerR family transcriptional regulator [candidate division KSB1 bacterium]